MITPTEIKNKAQRLYFPFLEQDLHGEAFFPYCIPADKGKTTDPFHLRAEGLRLLLGNSKEHKGYGYRVELKEVQTRKEGRQSIPTAIWIDSTEDYLRMIGKQQEYKDLLDDLLFIRLNLPELEKWAISNVKLVIKFHGRWNSLIEVSKYFLHNPHPNLYIRQLPILVHTKFIEQHKPILKELLDFLLSADQINQAEETFEKRYSLRYDEATVRFRILDKEFANCQFNGFDDLSVPISAFDLEQKGIEKVFIAENKMNVLTFPNVSKAIIIFGGGFSIGQLRGIKWLQAPIIQVFYWGDLDIAGFQILSLLRSFLPNAKSLMMNLETWKRFDGNAELINSPNAPKYLPGLTEQERELYDSLLLATVANRLEQEKLPQWWVEKEVNAVVSQELCNRVRPHIPI